MAFFNRAGITRGGVHEEAFPSGHLPAFELGIESPKVLRDILSKAGSKLSLKMKVVRVGHVRKSHGTDNHTHIDSSINIDGIRNPFSGPPYDGSNVSTGFRGWARLFRDLFPARYLSELRLVELTLRSAGTRLDDRNYPSRRPTRRPTLHLQTEHDSLRHPLRFYRRIRRDPASGILRLPSARPGGSARDSRAIHQRSPD